MNEKIIGVISQPKITARLGFIVKTDPTVQELNVTENGTYNVPQGVDGFKPVNVNVPNPSSGSVTFTENGAYDVTEKAEAVVNVPAPTLITKSITANGIYNAADDNADGYSEVSVQTENKLPKVLADAPVTLTADDFAGCTKIEQYFFNGKSNLSGTVSLPNSITTIGRDAFHNCENLNITHLPENLTTISINAFQNCKSATFSTLPSGITAINSAGLQGCESAPIVAVPNGLTTLGNYAFYGCYSILFTTLPNTVTSIGISAFQYCNFTEFVLPASITTIGNTAFADCTNLETVTFLGTPSSISTSTFSRCANLTQIRVPWSEGEVANAPWGATKATITYNYTGE